MLGHVHQEVLMCIYHKKDQIFMGLSLYWPLETEMTNQGSMEQQNEEKKKEMGNIRTIAAV